MCQAPTAEAPTHVLKASDLFDVHSRAALGRMLHSVSQVIDMSDVDSLILERCFFEDVTVLNLRGQAYLGAAGTSTFRGCRFERPRLDLLNLGRSSLEVCIFNDMRVRQLWSFDASIMRCEFSGVLKTAIITTIPALSSTRTEPVAITGNDFSRCVLEDVDFRGAIDLDAQLFDTEAVFPITRFEERLARVEMQRTLGPAERKWVDFVRGYMRDYGQEHVFIPSKLWRHYGAEIRELIRHLTLTAPG
jgi:hypothetical protein